MYTNYLLKPSFQVAIAVMTGYMIESIFRMYSRLIPKWQQRSKYVEGKVSRQGHHLATSYTKALALQVGAIVFSLCLLYTMAVRITQAIFRQYKRVTSNELYDKICDKIFEKICEKIDV